MPRNYRPRPIQDRHCEHCHSTFQTNHARTKYCSDSCRVQAFYARQDSPQVSQVQLAQEPVKAQLDFSLANLGVGAVSSGFIAILNQQFNDSPAHKKLLNRIDTLADQFTANQQQLSHHMRKQDAFIEAMKQVHIDLQWSMNSVSQQRELASPKDSVSIREKAEAMLAKRRAKGGF